MQVKIKVTGELLHVEKSSAIEILKKVGLIEYVAAATPVRPACDIVWQTAFSGRTFEHFVRASCPTCGEAMAFYNPTERNARWGHAGRLEHVPAEILVQYRQKIENAEERPVRDTTGTVHYL